MADANLNEIAKLLSILEKNYTSVAKSFYTIFYDPVAREEVEIKIYDDKDIEVKNPNGTDLKIPNRAYDMRFLQNGEGSPEGVVSGKGRGTMYVDTSNGALYIKTTDETYSTGWALSLDQAKLNDVIRRGPVSPEGVVTANKGALYVEAGTTAGSTVNFYIKTTDSGNTGWLSIGTSAIAKVDNKTITLNGSNEVQAAGVLNARDNSTAIRSWTGTKAQYDALTFDNYTVSGSPTITSDGIASGFVIGNYIKTQTLTMGSTSSFRVNFKFSVGSSLGNGWVYKTETGGDTNLCLLITSSGLSFHQGSTTAIKYVTYNTLSKDFEGYFEKQSNTKYAIHIVDTTNNVIVIDEIVNTVNGGNFTSSILDLGRVYSTGTNGLASIDLKRFSVTVDGEEVYRACGRPDASTLYNITDDVDVTLTLLQTIYPVGSIYITTNNTCPLSALFGTWQIQSEDMPNCVIEKGTSNGVSYRIWQDGYCEQEGNSNGGGNGSTVNLVKTYADTNYFIFTSGSIVRQGSYATGVDIEDTGKTSNSFKYHTWNVEGVGTYGTFNWKTSGYLASGQYTPKTQSTKTFRRIA